MKLNNLEAEIVVDGKPATEYPDEDFEQNPTDNAASRYIEVVAGARFEIRCTVPPKYKLGAGVDYLGFRFTVDGVRARGKFLARADCRSKKHESITRTGFRVNQHGREMEERFRFGSIQTYEGALTAGETIDQAQAFKNIGQIVVQAKRKKGGPSKTVRRSCDGTGALHSHSGVSFNEKVVAKDAQSLAVQKEEATVYKAGGSWRGVAVDSVPIATFIFKYRSKEGLRQLGIVKRTPTPPPPVALEDRDPATLTQDELIEALRRRQARDQEQQAKIKREAREANLRQHGVYDREHDDDEIKVVQDAGLERANKRRKAEVVDLSD